jgi:hypothetical protein
MSAQSTEYGVKIGERCQQDDGSIFHNMKIRMMNMGGERGLMLSREVGGETD